MLSQSLRLSVPAKINLHLRVGPRRDDGFHPLLTWMTTIGLFDSLLIAIQESESSHAGHLPIDSPVAAEGSRGDRLNVQMTCSDASLPCDGRNLVVKAAQAFGKDESIGVLGNSVHRSSLLVRIHLEKRIPAGGGLGGGSSDAASTLLGLHHLTAGGDAKSEIPRLARIAERLGSDVPFFLYGPSSICQGRGEAVLPIGAPSGMWVTLVLPPIGMPTADVYRKFDEMKLGREEDVTRTPNWEQWKSLNAISLLPNLVNDLETPAFAIRPDLKELRQNIEQLVGRIVRMSGSGSSLFTLFDSQEEAEAAAKKIASRFEVKAHAVPLAPVS